MEDIMKFNLLESMKIMTASLQCKAAVRYENSQSVCEYPLPDVLVVPIRVFGNVQRRNINVKLDILWNFEACICQEKFSIITFRKTDTETINYSFSRLAILDLKTKSSCGKNKCSKRHNGNY